MRRNAAPKSCWRWRSREVDRSSAGSRAPRCQTPGISERLRHWPQSRLCLPSLSKGAPQPRQGRAWTTMLLGRECSSSRVRLAGRRKTALLPFMNAATSLPALPVLQWEKTPMFRSFAMGYGATAGEGGKPKPYADARRTCGFARIKRWEHDLFGAKASARGTISSGCSDSAQTPPKTRPNHTTSKSR